MKSTASLLFFVLIAFSSQGVQSATYDTRDFRSHGDWASLELYIGDESTFRSVNLESYSDAIFSVDYYPGNCGSPLFSTRIEMDERYSITEELDYSKSDFRVDEREIQNGLAKISIERGDSGLYFHYIIPDEAKLSRDMRNGQVLRIKISREDADPLFFEFSLRGSMAAMSRAASKCHEVSQGPENFFNDNDSSESSA